MKILQVSNFLAPVRGGSAEVPLRLSKALAKRNQEITVYTSSRNFDPQLLSGTGIDVHAFKSRFQLANFDITPGMIGGARKKTKDFNIIHLHNYRTFQNIVAYHYAKINGVPYVLQAHGSLTTYFQKGLLKKLFDFTWGKQIIKDTARVFAVTSIEAVQYRSLGVSDDKIDIVPHGIDLTEFDGPLPTGEFKKKYGLSEDQKIILYMGRLHKMKGLDILAAAFKELCRKDTKLVIAGPDDGYLTPLKKLVAELGLIENSVFTGLLQGREKIQAYHDCDIFVLPSSYEIFGITILEAWACNKPVIVTDRCGLADAVKGNSGLVVPYDKAKLAEALSRMLDNPSLRLSYGAQGRKMVEEKYNWDNISKHIEVIYEKILTDRGKGG